MREIQVLDKGYVDLIDTLGNELSIVSAARVSFNKDQLINPEYVEVREMGSSEVHYIPSTMEELSEKDKKLIRFMLIHKHTSPFEHVVFTFLVKCPLFVRSQWHRHRTWSYNEISRRYTSEDIDFYIPTELRKQSESNKQASTDEVISEFKLNSVYNHIQLISEDALNEYKFLIENGVAREQARMVLPQNMYTRFYATVNLHNLLHFLELRNSEHSQYEIRLYAQAIEKLIEPIVPNTFKVWKELKNDN